MLVKIKDYFLVFSIILFGVILRAGYLLAPHIDSDQAIFGLQAIHILKGEYPIFSWGYAYIGTLQSYIDALFFLIFGVSRHVLNAVALIFFVGYALSIYYFASIIFKNKLFTYLAVLFASFSPEYFLIHGAWARHGYPETYFFGTLILAMISDYITKGKNKKLLFLFVLFFISGLAWWSNFLVVYYFIPLLAFIVYLLRNRFQTIKIIFVSFIAFILGSLPFWLYNLSNNFESLKMFEKKTPLFSLKEIFLQFINYSFPTLIGAKKYGSWECIPYIWEIYCIFFGLIIFSLVVYSYRDCLNFIFKNKLTPELIVVIFLFSLFGIFFKSNVNVGRLNTRYLIPFYSVYPILIVYFLRFIFNLGKKFLTFVFFVLILCNNLYSAYLSVPYFNRQVVDMYEKEINGENRFFNKLKSFGKKHFLMYEYWKAALFTFDSKEELIFAYVKSRYPLYISEMIEKNDFNYLLRKNEKIIEHSINAFNCLYQKKIIDGFKILYNFNRKIRFIKSDLKGNIYIENIKTNLLNDKNYSTYKNVMNKKLMIELNNKSQLYGLSLIFAHPVNFLISLKIRSGNELLFQLDNFAPGYCINGYPFIPKESYLCEIYFKKCVKTNSIVIEINSKEELKLSEILGIFAYRERYDNSEKCKKLTTCSFPIFSSLGNLYSLRNVCKNVVYKNFYIIKPKKSCFLAPEKQYLEYSKSILNESLKEGYLYEINGKKLIKVISPNYNLIFIGNVILKCYSVKSAFDYYKNAEKLLAKGNVKKSLMFYEKALRCYPYYYYAYKRLLDLNKKNRFEFNRINDIYGKYFEFCGCKKAVFDNRIELYFNFVKGDFKSGDKIKIEKIFVFKRNLKNNFYVFVHFINEKGEVMLTADHKIKSKEINIEDKKFYEGELIKDTSFVKIPVNFKFKGKLQIWLGLWNPKTGKRFDIKGDVIEESKRLQIGEIFIND